MKKIELGLVAFCAEECARQQSGEYSVYRMVFAASALQEQLAVARTHFSNMVLSLGRVIEPTKNAHGWRTTPVTFADGSMALEANLIPRQMRYLAEAVADRELSPAEIYQQLMEIHPFIDGNGRVGALIYNALTNGLDYPTTPPEFKKR